MNFHTWESVFKDEIFEQAQAKELLPTREY
jgi:hypothetical protein